MEQVEVSQNSDDGFLYCFTSSFMPLDHYKLGMTINLQSRFQQYCTYHLSPQFVITTSKMSDIRMREQCVFKKLEQYRIQSNREFFKVETVNLIFT